MTIYLIAGLGADKRIFKNLELPPGYSPVYIDWIVPLQNETLENYALRLAENIDTSEPFILAGLSFGGMLAVEIAKKYPPVQLILFSSIPCYNHLPWYLRFAGKLRLEKIVPVKLLQSAAIMKRFFTSETREEKAYLRHTIRSSDPHLIKWSMHAILTWKTFEVPSSYVHIHGSHDEILPLRYTAPTHTVKDAGHLMVLSRSREVNSILSEVLSLNT